MAALKKPESGECGPLKEQKPAEVIWGVGGSFTLKGTKTTSRRYHYLGVGGVLPLKEQLLQDIFSEANMEGIYLFVGFG